MIEELWQRLIRRDDVRGTLTALRSAIREEENFEKAADLAGDGAELILLLDFEDPKVRKNAAALLGDLAITEAAEALFLAYEREQTLFVRATLLAALENTDALPYQRQLSEQYERLCSRVPAENEKKHIREELHALERILRTDEKEKKHTFTGWREKLTILLTTNPLHRYVTLSALEAPQKKESALGVMAVVDDLRQVTKIRTYRELLFPIRLQKPVTTEDAPELLGERLADSILLPLLTKCHKEPAPFYFRVELRSGLSLQERGRYVKRMAAVLEEKSGRQLLNAADSYEYEIRLLPDSRGGLHAFLKMNTILDQRFSYRKETIAASIHPSAAAMLMELARPWMREHAQILDPCCGVGTMLAERNHILPAREIYAIDIFGEAIEKAKVNCAAAGLSVNFIHRDYLDFKHEYLFDEIISNMPVRGKRTKEEQERFYEGFFKKSAEILKPGGRMILYSNEEGFLKKQLRLHKEWELQQEYIIRKKDQFVLYIIGLRENTKHGSTDGQKWKNENKL